MISWQLNRHKPIHHVSRAFVTWLNEAGFMCDERAKVQLRCLFEKSDGVVLGASRKITKDALEVVVIGTEHPTMPLRIDQNQNPIRSGWRVRIKAALTGTLL
jgi:hypothetical protein